MRKAVYHFVRQARHAGKRKIARNAPSLVPPRPFRARLFLLQVSIVFHRRFDAGDIERARLLVDRQRDLLVGNKMFKPHGGLLEELRRGHAIAGVIANVRAPQHFQIRFVSPAARLEPLPTIVGNQAGRATNRREPQIGVIDAQKQAMFRSRREHSIRLETPARHKVVDEDTDVRLVPAEYESRLTPNRFRRVDAGHDSSRVALSSVG